MKKIRKGDEVVIISGKDKGKRGMVLRCLDNGRIVIEGINRIKKHQRPLPQKNITGGIIDKNMPIQIANVALYNSVTQKADRVTFKKLEDGRKARVFRSNGELVKV